MTKSSNKKITWKPPVFKNFRSTDLLNAFVLNALATAVIASMTVVVDGVLTELTEKHDWKLSPAVRRLIAFVLAFVTGLICYLLLYFFVGFGGGLLTNKKVEFIN